MEKAIVTTTINPPTEALKKFAEIAVKDGWVLVIVGDTKTPHREYYEMQDQYEGAVKYLDPGEQEDISKELSDLIGWNCIQRRNFGFIYAYQNGAEIIATVDDDNIPYQHWGMNCKVNKKAEIALFKSKQYLFDPLSVTFPNLWHRGFPIQMLNERNIQSAGLKKRDCLVQADMWDGDPDIDAVARIALAPEVTFKPSMLDFASDKPGPFNSQNTFVSRKVLKDYFMFPHIGRMDDIWASYWVQSKYPECVIYHKASVYQKRNEHDLSVDLERELIGYKNTMKFTTSLFDNRITNEVTRLELLKANIGKDSFQAFEVYRKLLK